MPSPSSPSPLPGSIHAWGSPSEATLERLAVWRYPGQPARQQRFLARWAASWAAHGYGTRERLTDPVRLMLRLDESDRFLKLFQIRTLRAWALARLADDGGARRPAPTIPATTTPSTTKTPVLCTACNERRYIRGPAPVAYVCQRCRARPTRPPWDHPLWNPSELEVLEAVDVAERALDADHRPARLRSARWQTAALALDDAELSQARIEAVEHRRLAPLLGTAEKQQASLHTSNARRQATRAAQHKHWLSVYADLIKRQPGLRHLSGPVRARRVRDALASSRGHAPLPAVRTIRKILPRRG